MDIFAQASRLRPEEPLPPSGGAAKPPTASGSGAKGAAEVAPATPRPGVGGNGAASQLPNLGGKSPADAVKALEGAGFAPKSPTPSAGGWQTFKHPDGSKFDIHFPSGRVVRGAAPQYGPDGSRINRGQRLGPDGAEIPRDLPHNQHPPETLGGN